MKLNQQEEFALFGAIEHRIRQLETIVEDASDETMRKVAEIDIELLTGILEKMGF